jgi:hypothetical protein
MASARMPLEGVAAAGLSIEAPRGWGMPAASGKSDLLSTPVQPRFCEKSVRGHPAYITMLLIFLASPTGFEPLLPP